jgi:FkbM family methyltransferase
MIKKSALKLLLRSRSWSLTRNSHQPFVPSAPLQNYCWNGHAIHYRPGTSDAHLIYGILLKKGKKAEYRLPQKLAPKVIFDIGANIGISSIYFADRFPKASIFAIEPMPENFEVLKRNAEGKHITPINVGLDSEDGQRDLILSPAESNFGGLSFYQRGAAPDAKRVTVNTRNPANLLRELGVGKVDMIKIDTEGAEYPILTAFDPELLKEVTWITGELHGEQDFELLAYLAQWFDIELKRSFKKPLFIFNACNKKKLDLV